MAAISRATSLLNKPFNARYSQKHRHLESFESTTLGINRRRHPSGYVVHQGLPLLKRTSIGTNYLPKNEPVTVGSLLIMSMTRSRNAVPLVRSTMLSQLGGTTKVWDAHKDITSYLSCCSYSYPPGIGSIPSKHHKTFVGSRCKAHLDIMQNQECLRSSMDDFLAHVLSIIISGFHPALVYIGGVFFTFSLSMILFFLSFIFFS
ncbi:hypothetical protein K445DRAFT_22095 [Daldinia sp. EC12]|nr:hypothetical protein K445DRAFT_22095 [Daldinia sp. EC12]